MESLYWRSSSSIGIFILEVVQSYLECLYWRSSSRLGMQSEYLYWRASSFTLEYLYWRSSSHFGIFILEVLPVCSHRILDQSKTYAPFITAESLFILLIMRQSFIGGTHQALIASSIILYTGVGLPVLHLPGTHCLFR